MIVKPLLHATFVKIMRAGELVYFCGGSITIVLVEQRRLTNDAGVIDKSFSRGRNVILGKIRLRQSHGRPPISTIEALEVCDESMSNTKDAVEIIVHVISE